VIPSILRAAHRVRTYPIDQKRNADALTLGEIPVQTNINSSSIAAALRLGTGLKIEDSLDDG
jgi:hypothetical protein